MDILALLTAATQLAPVIENIFGIVESSVNGAPITADQGNAVFTTLESAAADVPMLAPIIPIVEKQFDGTALTDADITTMQSVSDAIDAAISAKAAEIEAGSGAGTASATS